MIVSIPLLCPVYSRAHEREPYFFSHWCESPCARAVADGLSVEELRQHRAERGRARAAAWRAPVIVLVSGSVMRMCTRANSWEDDGQVQQYDSSKFPPTANEFDGCKELASGHMFAPTFATLATYEETFLGKANTHSWKLCCVHMIPSGGVVLPRVLQANNAKAMRRVRMGFKRALSRAEKVSAWLVGGRTRRM
jgi:hypothetical protein